MEVSKFNSITALTEDDTLLYYSGKSYKGSPTPILNFVESTANPCNIFCASLDIPSADVLQLNATPLEIVAAPGAGYAIVCIKGSFVLTFNTTAYATIGNIQIITNGAVQAQITSGSDFLFGTVSHIATYRANTQMSAVTDTQIIENQALYVQTPAVDPTAGDSDIKITVMYYLISL